MRHCTGGRRSAECKTPGVFQMGIMDLTLPTFMICLLFAGVCSQCTEPKHPGTGTTASIRYFYNPRVKACFPFQYNGQGGNSNNHVSNEACKCTCLNDVAACASVRPNREVCKKDLVRGNCALTIVGWYYNITTMQCRRTIFGCAFTNGNKFPDKKTCKSLCKDISLDSTGFFKGKQDKAATRPGLRLIAKKGSVVPPELSSLPKRCLLQKRHGKHGRDAGQRFFFDTATKTCLAFHYNGEGGNKNRFGTKKDCKCTCLQTNCG